MKDLHFAYEMQLLFDVPVEQHRFTLKCIPRTNERQTISGLSVDVYPKKFLSESTDSYGNHCIYGYSEEQHDHFSVRVTGKAATGLKPWETAGEPHQVGLFKYQTRYTEPGPCLCAFAEKFPVSPQAAALEKAEALMRALYSNFQYVPGVTDFTTTAEQAMSQGRGVCQDYSHILLSLCRMQHIPCKYVVGMLLGEGLSHAWVEVCDDGRWYALDPTNNLVVDDQHIKISSGRDYDDCTINQGVFVGRAVQTQRASVTVCEQ